MAWRVGKRPRGGCSLRGDGGKHCHVGHSALRSVVCKRHCPGWPWSGSHPQARRASSPKQPIGKSPLPLLHQDHQPGVFRALDLTFHWSASRSESAITVGRLGPLLSVPIAADFPVTSHLDSHCDFLAGPPVSSFPILYIRVRLPL